MKKIELFADFAQEIKKLDFLTSRVKISKFDPVTSVSRDKNVEMDVTEYDREVAYSIGGVRTVIPVLDEPVSGYYDYDKELGMSRHVRVFDSKQLAAFVDVRTVHEITITNKTDGISVRYVNTNPL